MQTIHGDRWTHWTDGGIPRATNAFWQDPQGYETLCLCRKYAPVAPPATSEMLEEFRQKEAMNTFPKGNPDDPKSEAFRALYALAKREGERRFGSACKHEKTLNGRCCKCLRKVTR